MKIFRYKLDFYYQQTLMYLVALLLYAGIRGNFVEDQFTLIYRDPIMYIMAFFFLVSLVVLLLNRIRDRKLMLDGSKIIFHSRNRERVIETSDLEWMHIGRERFVQTAGRFQLVVFKTKSRRRIFRVRIGRYERADELVQEMQRIAEHVPRRKHRTFGMRRRRSV
ncbi:MAG: hypothetical protein HY563_03455 [Ignavibacteriales bacterium]|jgi:hypothetical protein|nr:hypothetical protein [Ignavibacteriales bacterium]